MGYTTLLSGPVLISLVDLWNSAFTGRLPTLNDTNMLTMASRFDIHVTRSQYFCTGTKEGVKSKDQLWSSPFNLFQDKSLENLWQKCAELDSCGMWCICLSPLNAFRNGSAPLREGEVCEIGTARIPHVWGFRQHGRAWPVAFHHAGHDHLFGHWR